MAQWGGRTKRLVMVSALGAQILIVTTVGLVRVASAAADHHRNLVVTASGHAVDAADAPAAASVATTSVATTVGTTTTVPQATLPQATASTLAPTTVPRSTTSVTSPPTTAPPPTTTTTAAAATAQVTIVNTFGDYVTVGVEGVQYQLAAGESRGPIAVTPSASGNDSVGVTPDAHPTCGMGGARKYFDAGKSYTVTVVSQPNTCLGGPGPAVVVKAT